MIENWIDALTKVWEIDDHKGSTVKSYRIFEKAEFPADVPLDRAVALTFVHQIDRIEYSDGLLNIGWWVGSTTFNLAPNVDMNHLPYVIGFFTPILVAAAANFTLGDRVSHFVIGPNGQPPIELQKLQYGQQAQHWGLVVNWEVKEKTEGISLGRGT